MTSSRDSDSAIREVNRADAQGGRRGRSKAVKHPEPQQQQADRSQGHRDGEPSGSAGERWRDESRIHDKSMDDRTRDPSVIRSEAVDYEAWMR